MATRDLYLSLLENVKRQRQSNNSFTFLNFLFLSLNFAILLLILRLVIIILGLVLLILSFQSALCSLIDSTPHFTNDLSDLCNFGIGVFSLHILIDLTSEKEEGRKWLFWRSRLNYVNITLVSSLFFFPILYRLEYKGLFTLNKLFIKLLYK